MAPYIALIADTEYGRCRRFIQTCCLYAIATDAARKVLTRNAKATPYFPILSCVAQLDAWSSFVLMSAESRAWYSRRCPTARRAPDTSRLSILVGARQSRLHFANLIFGETKLEEWICVCIFDAGPVGDVLDACLMDSFMAGSQVKTPQYTWSGWIVTFKMKDANSFWERKWTLKVGPAMFIIA